MVNLWFDNRLTLRTGLLLCYQQFLLVSATVLWPILQRCFGGPTYGCFGTTCTGCSRRWAAGSPIFEALQVLLCRRGRRRVCVEGPPVWQPSQGRWRWSGCRRTGHRSLAV